MRRKGLVQRGLEFFQSPFGGQGVVELLKLLLALLRRRLAEYPQPKAGGRYSTAYRRRASDFAATISVTSFSSFART